MDTKKPRMKKEQQQYLLNFLMRNPETVNGNCQLPATKRLWTKLTEALNGMGGVRKTQKDWLETYKLLARRAKAKMRTQRASMQRTGGGPPADICLTELEKKTINIEGTSTIYGLPGVMEAGIIIVPGTPQPIVDVPDPHVKQNIVMVLDDTQLPKPKQTLILDAVTVDIHSDTEEEPLKEAAIVDALTPTASHDEATVVTSMATDASSIPTASRVGRIAVDALMMPAANRDLATISCSREHTVASTPEQRLEDGVVRNTPRLERRNARRATPRTLVPPADSATLQEDAMIAALREGAQAQMALANAQTEAARYLGDCIMRAATMFVEAINKNK
ncbi:unnamed protein product [Parnassius apollo]|uniref:(apollo) hypothetical protein n=1 Tax=Parnassius apollo TaxID=110799 RepID=A0A8S3XG91_PARAO|nr:unnamed protein product [Parnassius apollo]